MYGQIVCQHHILHHHPLTCVCVSLSHTLSRSVRPPVIRAFVDHRRRRLRPPYPAEQNRARDMRHETLIHTVHPSRCRALYYQLFRNGAQCWRIYKIAGGSDKDVSTRRWLPTTTGPQDRSGRMGSGRSIGRD